MNRKDFIVTCGLTCLGGLASSLFLQGCVPGKFIPAAIEGSDLVLPISAFEMNKKNGIEYRKYIIAENDQLQFPVCIIREDEKKYSAMLMRCSHQGAELQAFGDKLQCPAHGSEFNLNGEVITGPASEGLRNFPVILESGNLKISLK